MFTGSPKFRLHGSIGSGRMSGTAELLGIRSGIVARVVCTHGTVWCAESVAVSCRVPNRRHDQAIESGLCRVSVLCRAVLLCCVVLVGVESRVWSVSESGAGLCRVLRLVCVLVSTWSGLVCAACWCRVVRLPNRIVLCRVVSSRVTNWSNRITNGVVSCLRVVSNRITCRVRIRFGLVVLRVV